MLAKDVHGEAVALLSRINADSPIIHLRQAEWQLSMQLPNEAQDAYQSALQRAQAAEDKESEAAAQAGLACIAKDEATRSQTTAAAKGLYQALGYGETEIERLLTEACE